MQFAIERYLLQDLAAISFEGGAEVVNIDAAQFGHEPVRNARGDATHPEIIDANLAPAADDIVTGRNLFQKHWNVGRIVLQIAIHRDDVFATRMVETGGQSGGLAEVAPELDHGDPAIDGSDFAQHGEGVIAGAIIHQHDFKGLASRLHYRLQAVIEIGDVLLLVMQWDDYGIFRHSLFII